MEQPKGGQAGGNVDVPVHSDTGNYSGKVLCRCSFPRYLLTPCSPVEILGSWPYLFPQLCPF